MIKAIRIKVFQQMPNYRKPSSFMIKETFPLPPYSTIIGMVHNACGYTKYHPMKVSVQGKYGCEVAECFTSYSFNPGSAFENGRHQYYVENEEGKHIGINKSLKYAQLLTDVELVIHILPEDYRELDEILDGLKNPREYLSLGRREDIVRVDDVSIVELEKTDEDEEYFMNDYSAYLPEDYISEYDKSTGGISGTIYNVPKIFEIFDASSKKRSWKEIVKARYLPPNKMICDSVADNSNVYYDIQQKVPVFFA